MSNNLKKTTDNVNNEEIDLVVILNLIGNGFNRVFNFIGSIFKSIFSFFIYSIKAVIDNAKILVPALVVSAIIGFVLQQYSPTVYTSQILVKPYFESKYQLVTNINYYNSLILNKDYKSLTQLFNISQEEADNLVSFEVEPGPETENQRIIQYDNFIKSIDSIRAAEISFDDFIENRSIYSGDLFLINAFAKDKYVFKKLEEGLNGSFTNEYSLKKMKKRDSLISIQKANITQQISQVDSLQKIYINVLEEESRSKSSEFSIGGESLSLSKEKSKTREFDLLTKEIELRNQLKTLEERKVQEDVFFDIISSFPEVGSVYSSWTDLYVIIFPVLTFILLVLLYISIKIIRYAKTYDS